MKKLAMKLDDLRVDSFVTGPEMDDRRGTVQGHAKDSNTCPPPSEWCGSFECTGLCSAMCSDQCTFTADYQCMETANVGCA